MPRYRVSNARGDRAGGAVLLPDKSTRSRRLEGGGIALGKRGKREPENAQRDCQSASHGCSENVNERPRNLTACTVSYSILFSTATSPWAKGKRGPFHGVFPSREK